MNILLRGLVLTLLATTAGPALAQDKIVPPDPPVRIVPPEPLHLPKMAPPEPLPMATAYVYTISDQYVYPTLAYYPTFYTTPPLSRPTPPVGVVAYYSTAPVAYPSPYPFGSYSPVFGLYSWDYGVYYPTAYGWYPYSIVNYPSVYRYPLPLGRVWLGFGW
jgi:hypothetical protein